LDWIELIPACCKGVLMDPSWLFGFLFAGLKIEPVDRQNHGDGGPTLASSFSFFVGSDPLVLGVNHATLRVEIEWSFVQHMMFLSQIKR
jgi:hypothetical protein